MRPTKGEDFRDILLALVVLFVIAVALILLALWLGR